MSIRNKTSKTQWPPRLPGSAPEGSLLVAETDSMERRRRLVEQQGERQLAPVHALDHAEKSHKNSEGLENNGLLSHPAFVDSQYLDGIDPSVNPEPHLNTEARKEYDKALERQKEEKQLRKSLTPQFNTAPRPRGP